MSVLTAPQLSDTSRRIRELCQVHRISRFRQPKIELWQVQVVLDLQAEEFLQFGLASSVAPIVKSPLHVQMVEISENFRWQLSHRRRGCRQAG